MTNPSAARSLPGRPPSGRSRQPATVDALLAGLYAVVFLGTTLIVEGRKMLELPWFRGLGFATLAIDLRVELLSRAAIVLVLVCAIALAWRRSRPVASFLLICGVACVQVAIGEPVGLWNVAMPVSLFSVAAYGSRRFARVALGIAIAGYVGIWALETGVAGRVGSLPDPLSVLATSRGAAFVAMFAVLVVIWAVGDQVRSGQERLMFEREWAEREERAREAEARFGALAERQRIARELHDVVAHGLSVMIVQADGARYAEAQDPDAPRQALLTIAATGRESLAEMRRLLGVLRDDPDATRLAPQPGLADVPALMEGFRDTGLIIDQHVEGPARPVPPAVGLTAYRVVQEGLTNVLHHVGATHVDVRLRFDSDRIALLVANQPGAHRPPPARGDRQGLGLLGMRERVGLLGGGMTAGPTADGGFRVEVELPTGQPRPAGTRQPAGGASPAPGLDAAGPVAGR